MSLPEKRLPNMSLKSLTYARDEDGVVTFEDEDGYTIDCKKCNVSNIENYKQYDIIIAIINEKDGGMHIELLQKDLEEMAKREAEIAAAEKILFSVIGKIKR